MTYTFTEKTARRLLQMSRQGIDPGPLRTDNLHPTEPVIVRNDSGEVVPAYGCMMIADAELDSSGRYVAVIDKPDTTGGPYLFNGSRPIAINGYGVAQQQGTVRAAFASGTPLAGEYYGPDSTWELTRNTFPAVMVYGALSSDLLLGDSRVGFVTAFAKADSTITAGSSGTVSIWDDTSDTTDNVTAYLDWMDGGNDISSGKELLIMYFPELGRWQIIGAECEDVNLIQNVSGSFSVTAENGTYYFADTGSGDITVTLPAAVSNFRYSVKKSDSSANSVIVQTADSALIDGDTTKTIVTPFDSITVVCDGRDWWIV
jgi:hypothetical protein